MTTTTLAFDAAAPAEIFQTWVNGRVQDSSTPEVLVLRLTGGAAHALAAAAGPRRGHAADAPSSHDEPGGELGAFFHVVLLRSDLRPVEAWDPVSEGYAALTLPQNTFAFRRSSSGRVLMEMKRKHLPPSKNHGDVMFRLAVRLRLRVEGACPTCVSTPFRILSKQSATTGRPEPKRKRNPAPTKPFVAPLSGAAASLVAALAGEARAAALSHAASASSTVSSSAPSPSPAMVETPAVPRRPRRAAAIAAAARVAKRAREAEDAWVAEDADETASHGRASSAGSVWSQADEARAVAAAAASVPRPSASSGAAFRFTDDDDDEEDDEDQEEAAGVVLPVAHPLAERGRSHGSGRTLPGAATPGSEAISVEDAAWASETAFGEAAVLTAPETSPAEAFAASMATSALACPTFRRCRIMSDAVVLAAAAAGTLDSHARPSASPGASPIAAASPLPVPAGAPPALVPARMLADALALDAGVVLPRPSPAFASSLSAALVPIGPDSALHPSLC